MDMSESEFFSFTNMLAKLGIIPFHLRDAVDSVYMMPDSVIVRHIRELNRKGILKEIMLYNIDEE